MSLIIGSGCVVRVRSGCSRRLTLRNSHVGLALNWQAADLGLRSS